MPSSGQKCQNSQIATSMEDVMSMRLFNLNRDIRTWVLTNPSNDLKYISQGQRSLCVTHPLRPVVIFAQYEKKIPRELYVL